MVELVAAKSTSSANQRWFGTAHESQTEPDDEDVLCCICLDEHNQVATSCGHMFCEKCHDRWRRQNPHCPLCRATLPHSDNGVDDTFILAESVTTPAGWSNDNDDAAPMPYVKLVELIDSLPIGS
ncbi:hypothetical protein CYMTET_37176 [Cymbomonas tetramitiformis]|uniref:RING-type domain-containing protein n=1 Tax=Cymbomonas tetramitiformis TaxID=36881 RepID=A0AAE0CFW8_9CHLO|nr:hypothetical protein CYMTET_37176 [Cymbomonas tetramitiformis]